MKNYSPLSLGAGLLRYVKERSWVQVILFIYQAHVAPEQPKREPFDRIRL